MNKPKTALLLLALTVSAALGAWLLISPTLDKRDALAKQAALLASLDAASSAETSAPSALPLYQTESDTEPTSSPGADGQRTPAAAEPTAAAAVPEPEETPVITEPVDDAEFPGGITGVGILTVEKIDLRLPVGEGIGEAALRITPGHVPETAAIGETGNAVIAGHRNYDYGDQFNRLDEIETGDIIGYKAKSGEELRFEVFEIAVINPGDPAAFIQPQDESIITLYTCTPVRVATHRLLVRARLTEQ